MPGEDTRLFSLLNPKRLSRSEQLTLLALARDAIQAQLDGREPLAPSKKGRRLSRKDGVFVTLMKNGKLRGCIGYLQTDKPLYQSVPELAVSAACHDPRFQPLRPEELPESKIEISVLSGLRPLTASKNIRLNRDGILVRSGKAQGILLPQVATRYNWDRETFLEHACIKAGLPGGAWKEKDVELYAFTAQVFEE